MFAGSTAVVRLIARGKKSSGQLSLLCFEYANKQLRTSRTKDKIALITWHILFLEVPRMRNIIAEYAILIALVLLLNSCSSRQDIHIYSKGITYEEISRLVEIIEKAGFNANPNTLDVPPSITSTSIMYPPIVEDFTSIEVLADLLSRNGYLEVALRADSQEGHSYTTRNMGLYLVDPNFVEEEQDKEVDNASSSINLSKVYLSNCAELEADISLYSQGVAILNIYDWVEGEDNKTIGMIEGEWSATDSKLFLNLSSVGNYEYEIAEFTGRDDYGRYYGIELLNTLSETELPHCNFVYIEY